MILKTSVTERKIQNVLRILLSVDLLKLITRVLIKINVRALTC